MNQTSRHLSWRHAQSLGLKRPMRGEILYYFARAVGQGAAQTHRALLPPLLISCCAKGTHFHIHWTFIPPSHANREPTRHAPGSVLGHSNGLSSYCFLCPWSCTQSDQKEQKSPSASGSQQSPPPSAVLKVQRRWGGRVSTWNKCLINGNCSLNCEGPFMCRFFWQIYSKNFWRYVTIWKTFSLTLL